jgi:hypothetical protein
MGLENAALMPTDKSWLVIGICPVCNATYIVNVEITNITMVKEGVIDDKET